MTVCPICLSIDGYSLAKEPQSLGENTYFDCPVCGRFGVDRDMFDDYLNPEVGTANRRIRAILSHWVRLNQNQNINTLLLESSTYCDARDGRINLPTPAQVALSIVSRVGDYVQKNGERMASIPAEFSADVGAVSRETIFDLIAELGARGLIRYIDGRPQGELNAFDLDLTLAGWEFYQSEKHGNKSAGYGFLAMKFGDPQLELLAQNHLKPAIKELGFELVDMRDVAEPGIIDNIMRMRIRDANFVIVDLTHDNSGAYWEGGYAEGLGKPVLYICERDKFAAKQTHFDTSHCTTVMWSANKPADFCRELIATLRRALPSE